MLRPDSSSTFLRQSNDISGFLKFEYYPKELATKGHAGYAELTLVHNTSNGQFDLQFCSVTCMRRFLNECMDEFERRIEELEAPDGSGA